MSGGRATVANRSGKDVRQCGDIAPVAPEGNKFCELFYVEVKHYKDLKFGSLITGADGRDTLLGIWNKTVAEANKYTRSPLLIAKQNNWPTLLITDRDGAIDLDLVLTVPSMKPAAIFYDKIYVCFFDKVMNAPAPSSIAHRYERVRKIKQ